MTPNCTIRAVEKRDIDDLLEMIAGLAAFHEDTALIDTETLERELFGDAPWISGLIAEIGGEAAGYAILIPRIQLQISRRGMEMHHLFVHDRFRGQGLGRALIDACREQVAQHGGVFLVVGTAPENTTAQQTYLHTGFKEVTGHGPRFWSPVPVDNRPE